MAAIDDAEKAVKELGEKHQGKFFDLWGTKGGDFWTRKEEKTPKKQVPDTTVKPWSVFLKHDGRVVSVDRFRTQLEARLFVNENRGIKARNNLKVEVSGIITHSNSPTAKRLTAKLPKVRTKVKEQKPHQHNLFR